MEVSKYPSGTRFALGARDAESILEDISSHFENFPETRAVLLIIMMSLPRATVLDIWSEEDSPSNVTYFTD